MAFSTYSGLKTTLGVWLARTDAADDLNVYIDDFIDLAEERLARDVRIWGLETALSSVIASGVIAVPSDFLELKHAYIDGDPVQPLDQKEAWYIYRDFPTRSSDSKPFFIAIDGLTSFSRLTRILRTRSRARTTPSQPLCRTATRPAHGRHMRLICCCGLAWSRRRHFSKRMNGSRSGSPSIRAVSESSTARTNIRPGATHA